MSTQLPLKLLEMLLSTSMLEVHDDNGPGKFECPICCEKVLMKWSKGLILNSGFDIVHLEDCPVKVAHELMVGCPTCEGSDSIQACPTCHGKIFVPLLFVINLSKKVREK